MKKELQRVLGGVHTQIAVRQEGRIHTLPVYDRDGKGGFFQHEKVIAVSYTHLDVYKRQGFSVRDTTPAATLEVMTRNVPGIAEAIRAGLGE